MAGELGVFVQRDGRRAQKHVDPNDRRYDHDVERAMTRLSPTALSDLLAGDHFSEDDDATGSADMRRSP
ncbi:hypothetical protein [Burkholderia stabilis]|uniref:hypothetical protein n=1 Tax=Burkholderia stabilis TaxID=95485 RepID=UPI001F0C6724|nr:hypothetical protein [Burkholderia stabilis]